MNSSSSAQLTFPSADIAVLSIDVPGRSANMLSKAVLSDIAECLDQIEANKAVRAIILHSAKPNSFVVGADLAELRNHVDMDRQDIVDFFEYGKELFQRLTTLSAVTISAVHGACVGGGAELALWCDYCIASNHPKTCFGFPEVSLGLIPAWGGTVRAFHLAGIEFASEMLAGGKPIDADAAKQVGLVHQICERENLLSAATDLAQQSTANGQFRARRDQLATPVSITEAQNEKLEQRLTELRQKPESSVDAEIEVLELLQAGELLSVENALQLESVAMSRLFGSPANRALLNLYFLKQTVRRDSGIASDEFQPHPVQQVGIAGAGVMGQEISIANLQQGFPVLLCDIDESMQQTAVANICEKSPSPDQPSSEQLKIPRDLSELSSCEIVIETIVENQQAKQSYYETLEPALNDEACLLSNTSTIPITKLAEQLEHPNRFCGMHFFHPVAERPLLEIIRGEQTDDATIATAFEYGKQLGKFPIVVGDSPGFVVNRLLFLYVNEALKLFEEGASLRQIDQAAVDFGMPYGPISHFDRVGLDTAAYSGGTIYMHYFRRLVVTPILPKLVKAKRLGIKVGKGFYSYENPGRIAEDDPTLLDVVGQYLQETPTQFTSEQISMRLFLPVLVEATMILEEGVARSPGDIDLGMMLGLGFPKYKGGILFWADGIGAQEILELLKALEHLGPRYEPTAMMKRLAAENGKYYA